MTKARSTLTDEVVARSVSPEWALARLEWEVVGVSKGRWCVCGQPLKRSYVIGNKWTAEELSPIGTSCIDHFDSHELNRSLRDVQNLVELEAVVADQIPLYVDRHLTPSRLATLYTHGAFAPSRYNGGDPYRDYAFLLEMRRSRKPLNPSQLYRVDCLLRRGKTSLRTFLEETKSGIRPRRRVDGLTL